MNVGFGVREALCGNSVDRIFMFFMPEVFLTRTPVKPKALFTANAEEMFFVFFPRMF